MTKMKTYIILMILVATTCFSCSEIYNPKTDSVQNSLVVDGMITDEAVPYSIKLSTTVPYDSSGTNPAVLQAKVSILDDCGDTYNLTETGNGVYVSNPAELVGQPGKTYTLHIQTRDGNVYESEPQTLLPNDFDMTTYAQYDSQDNLVEDAYGQVTKVTTPGVDLLVDISNNTDSLPRFRFKPVITTEYTYTITVSPMLSYVYYCWYTSAPGDLANITDEKYQTSSTDIKKHTVYFQPTNYTYYASYTDSVTRKDSIVQAYVINQVITLSRYRINDQTYQFYKNINLLLSAQGKLFDPIAFQIQGNMTCKTNSQKQALGFFEASSVRTNIVAIKPGQISVKKVQSFNPTSSSDCVGGTSSPDPTLSSSNPPDFWVY
jgi:hypothetical protein